MVCLLVKQIIVSTCFLNTTYTYRIVCNSIINKLVSCWVTYRYTVSSGTWTSLHCKQTTFEILGTLPFAFWRENFTAVSSIKSRDVRTSIATFVFKYDIVRLQFFNSFSTERAQCFFRLKISCSMHVNYLRISIFKDRTEQNNVYLTTLMKVDTLGLRICYYLTMRVTKVWL